MKKSIISLAIASVFSTGAYAGMQDIVITELVQKNKQADIGSIELTNTHPTDDFTFSEDVYVEMHSSGKYNNIMRKADGTKLLTGVTLPAGKSIVLLNTKASAEYQTSITQNGGIALIGPGNGNYSNIYFNGDDGMVLKHNDTILDRVGAKGDGSIWGPDTTLRRREAADGGIPAQNPNFTISEWLEISPLNTEEMGAPNLAPPPEVFVCNITHTIAEVQGEGDESPVKGQTVTVEGVVTKTVSVPSSGFFIQSLVPDSNPQTSDGIFVFSKAATEDMTGKTVCLESEVKEYYGFTQLSANSWGVTDDSNRLPDAVAIEMLPSDAGLFANTMERYEGMLVRLPDDLDLVTAGKQDMRVTKTFSYNYSSKRNSMTLSYLRPNMQPNQLNVAGSEASIAARKQNDDYRLVIESAKKADNGIIPYYPDFNEEPADNHIRIDDSVIDLEGVVGYSYGDYNLTVTNTLTKNNFKSNLPRTDKPVLKLDLPQDHFDIKVASQNLFNYFNSPFGGDQNNFGQNRGADSYQEYEHQKAKLVKTIRALDADILGLMEMENNGFGLDSAIADLVNEVNTYYSSDWPSDSEKPFSSENRYVFVGFDHNGNQILDELDSIGSDAIATGIIYRPSRVSIERTRVITMPQQKAPSIVNDNNEVIIGKKGEALENGQNYNRDALVVTFVINQTGKRLTLAVNHFKSKASTCWEDWQGVEFGDATLWEKDPEDLDAQGSCEFFRVSAADHLGKEMAKLGGDRIILGDLNSYAQEDAMLVLTENPSGKVLTSANYTFIGHKPQYNSNGAAVTVPHSYGYIDAVGLKSKARGETPWSYSYNDEVGSLDHILISDSLSERLLDATDWHINAPESTLFDYNHEFKAKDQAGGEKDNGVEEYAAGDFKFYQADPFRSSDHDPAIIALSYRPGETDHRNSIRLPVWNKLISVPYQIPAAVELMPEDVAKITLEPTDDEARLDLSQLVLPNVVIKDSGERLIEFEVFGAPAADYQAQFAIYRDGELVAGSEMGLLVEVRKRDTLVPSLVTEPHDNSGGSIGLISILSLLGLAGLRRRFKH